MTDKITDAALDERLRSADPLRPGSLPSEADTEAALHRLLAAAPEAGRARGTPRRRVRLARPRLLAGTTAGAAAVGTTLALVLGGTATSSAFAVTRNHDGTVTVSIKRSSGIAGANAKLNQLGIRARVMPQAPSGCQPTLAHPPGGQAAPAPSHAMPEIANAHWTINPRQIPAGSTLALTPPPVPPGHSGNSGNSGSGSSSGNSGSGGQYWSCGTEGPGPGGNSDHPPGNSGNSGASGNS
jgi:hypothetical protein